MDDQANEIEQFINKEFNLSVDQALNELEKIKGSLLKVVNYLMSNVK